MDRLLWYLFAGSRGGPTRIRLLVALLAAPQNTNQLSRLLQLDYKTVEYNLRLLLKHRVILTDRPGEYGALYYPTKDFLARRPVFDAIAGATRQGRPSRSVSQSNWEKPEIEPDQR